MKILSSKKNISRLISIVLGIVVWIILIYTEDASFNVKLKGLDVQIAGEHQLFENHLVITNKDDLKRASVSVRGKRTDIIKSMGDITATVDVSGLLAPGSHNVKVLYNINTSAVYVSENNTPTIEVVLEKTKTKEMDVEVIQMGKIADDLIVESVLGEEKVIIEGAADDIDKVKYASVYVNIGELSADSEAEYKVMLLDSEHEEIEFENRVKADKEKIGVKNIIHKKATVPVKIDALDVDEEKYVLDVQSISKEKVSVGLLDGVFYNEAVYILNVREISDEPATFTAEWKEEPGVYMPENLKQLKVELSVVPNYKKTITVPIEVLGVDGQYELSDENLILNVKGAEKDITAENIHASIDLSEYKSGHHTVKVKVDLKKKTIDTNVDNHYISVVIKE